MILRSLTEGWKETETQPDSGENRERVKYEKGKYNAYALVRVRSFTLQ